MKTLHVCVTATVLLFATTTATQAAALEAERFYVGGGLSSNDLDGDDELGHQGFVGYELPFDLGDANTAVEVGFQDSGDFKVGRPGRRRTESIDGVWTTGVASLSVSENVDLVGRLGFDLGDDDGLMAGGGVGLDLPRAFELRGEYVIRDRTESLQANLLYRF